MSNNFLIAKPQNSRTPHWNPDSARTGQDTGVHSCALWSNSTSLYFLMSQLKWVNPSAPLVDPMEIFSFMFERKSTYLSSLKINSYQNNMNIQSFYIGSPHQDPTFNSCRKSRGIAIRGLALRWLLLSGRTRDNVINSDIQKYFFSSLWQIGKAQENRAPKVINLN